MPKFYYQNKEGDVVVSKTGAPSKDDKALTEAIIAEAKEKELIPSGDGSEIALPNFKTINGETIIGEGDISISGGSDQAEVIIKEASMQVDTTTGDGQISFLTERALHELNEIGDRVLLKVRIFNGRYTIYNGLMIIDDLWINSNPSEGEPYGGICLHSVDSKLNVFFMFTLGEGDEKRYNITNCAISQGLLSSYNVELDGNRYILEDPALMERIKSCTPNLLIDGALLNELIESKYGNVCDRPEAGDDYGGLPHWGFQEMVALTFDGKYQSSYNKVEYVYSFHTYMVRDLAQHNTAVTSTYDAFTMGRGVIRILQANSEIQVRYWRVVEDYEG